MKKVIEKQKNIMSIETRKMDDFIDFFDDLTVFYSIKDKLTEIELRDLNRAFEEAYERGKHDGYSDGYDDGYDYSLRDPIDE